MRASGRIPALALCLAAGPAFAQLAVSAEDGKQLRPHDVIDQRTPDQVSVIDLGRYPPKLLATIDAPASMIGPPGAVAVARDESFALVTAAQRLAGDDGSELVPADTVSVIDLSNPAEPRVRQTVQAGPGASGVAINRAGTLAMVASTEDDAVTVFAIRDGRLKAAGRVQLPDGARPTDVAFTPGGDRAVIVRRGDNRLSLLDVDGSSVSLSATEITPGRSPYGIAISPDGRFAYTNNLRGAVTRAELDAEAAAGVENEARAPGTVAAVDLATGEVVTSVEVGRTPETVALSPDGRLLAVVVANGASVQKLAPEYDSVHGLLHVFSVDGGTLRPVATLENGHWCQGAAFSRDGDVLLVQCGSERAIEVYRIDGERVVADSAATIETRSRGGSLATALSR